MKNIRKFPRIDGRLGWFETAPNHQEMLGAELVGSHECDICVIGAGFTGLSAAHRLAEREPDARIAVVEALKVGQGTSGRNAGFIIDVPHNVDGGKHDQQHDRQLFALNSFAIKRLQQWKDRMGADCQWDHAGKYMAAHESHNLAALDHFVAQLRENNFAYEDLDAAQLSKRLGISYYQRAIYTSGNILMNPAALVRIFAAGLPSQVTLFEQSPVTSIEYGQNHMIHTQKGMLKAGIVVEATNVFNEEFGRLKNRIGAVYTYASLTRALSPAESDKYFHDIKPWGLTSAHAAGTTVRFTPDRRLFIRNILKYSSQMQASSDDIAVAKYQHRHSFEKRFPALQDVEFEYSWGGMIGITLNQDSVFHRPADNILVLNGCNGVGVAKGTYLGYYAAEYLAGAQSPELSFIMKNSHPSWIAPEPLRSLVAKFRIWDAERKAGGDL